MKKNPEYVWKQFSATVTIEVTGQVRVWPEDGEDEAVTLLEEVSVTLPETAAVSISDCVVEWEIDELEN